MARQRRVLIGADVDDVLDSHFREIIVVIPEMLDLIERYTARIWRERAERDTIVREFRERMLDLIRTEFTVVLSDERPLDRIA